MPTFTEWYLRVMHNFEHSGPVFEYFDYHGLMNEVFIPEPKNQAAYGQILDMLGGAAPIDSEKQRATLKGADGGEVVIPSELFHVLVNVVEALKAGQAISVAPLETKLTTQQAADQIGVSRPTLIKLANAQGVQFELVGNHRRISLRDLLAMQGRMRSEQKRLLNEIIAVNVETGVYDLDDELMPTRA